jgi:hypothetical protein
MRRGPVILIRVGYILALIAAGFLFYPALKRAKVGGGPSPPAKIYIQLRMIDEDKQSLKETRNLSDDYWPTPAEIAAVHTGRTNYSFHALIKPSRWGEIYIVNRLGAPALALLTNAVGGFSEGRLLTADDLRPGARSEGAASRSQVVHHDTNEPAVSADSGR